MKKILLRPFSNKKGPTIYFDIDLGHELISCHYEIICDDELIIPPPISNPIATDNLWQHTCFELFCKKKGSDEYLEFNFSPSGEWNCYEFSSYREGMKTIHLSSTPNSEYNNHIFKVTFSMPEGKEEFLEVLHPCAVIECEKEKYYLSNEHLADRPDFHRF
ncbi:hypothetical protein M899_2010 [Bacteriovorax sp. BSW11_IV]|uniref:hypothetical protein n=1 Tax=Bacteriovorax sp. BSW11_IV TaxID=1353529 RepID=UPI00038A4BAB|nr:hypothetical protein [Bacteriovorax sp. BSW11_IV]EQC46404.1 hypothetical protein M899_2010 [Bacteriovorax sp. BSW11_IV]